MKILVWCPGIIMRWRNHDLTTMGEGHSPLVNVRVQSRAKRRFRQDLVGSG